MLNTMDFVMTTQCFSKNEPSLFASLQVVLQLCLFLEVVQMVFFSAEGGHSQMLPFFPYSCFYLILDEGGDGEF